MRLGQREAALRGVPRPLDGSFEVSKDIRQVLEDQLARIEAATEFETGKLTW